MGGYGSGRRRFPVKSTVEDCHLVDANTFARGKFFLPGERLGVIRWSRRDRETGSCAIMTSIEDKQAICVFQYSGRETTVLLAWYRPGYGGHRYFFICPECGRRMRTLFFKGSELACRFCHGLTYESCKKSHYFDGIYRQMAFRIKLSQQDVKNYLNMSMRAAKKRPKRSRGRPVITTQSR